MAIIENVQIGGVTPATAKNGKTYWKITYGNDQAIMVFEYDQAEAAKQFIGQFADIETAQNGSFTNFVAIRQANGTAPAQPAQTSSPRNKDPEVEARIVRQSSMKTAFDFVGSLYAGAGPEAGAEAEGAAFELAARIYAKAFGGDPAPNRQQTDNELAQIGLAVQNAQAQTSPAVVEQVNQVLGEGAIAQGSQIKW